MKSLVMLSAIMVTGAAMAQSTAPTTNPALPTDNRTQFDGLDINRDGRLSPSEASGLAPFNTADKDGNGSVDRNEYSTYLNRRESDATRRSCGASRNDAETRFIFQLKLSRRPTTQAHTGNQFRARHDAARAWLCSSSVFRRTRASGHLVATACTARSTTLTQAIAATNQVTTS